MAVVSGIVRDASGVLTRRIVRVHRKRDGAVAFTTISDATTGAFSGTALDGSKHFAVAFDSSPDPKWLKTVLLMRMNDAALSDDCGHAVTLNGGMGRSSAQSKFDGYSALFDGTNDSLTIATSTDFNIGLQDFCGEAWVYLNSATGLQAVFDRYDGSALSWQFAINGGKLNAYIRDAAGTGAAVNYTCPTISVATAGHHLIGYERISGVLKFYVDLVEAGSVAANYALTSAALPMTIGKQGNAASYFLNGYVDEARFTVGASRIADYGGVLPTARFWSLQDSPPENALIIDDLMPV